MSIYYIIVDINEMSLQKRGKLWKIKQQENGVNSVNSQNAVKGSKLVFSPVTAKYLLKCGYKIIDLKVNRNDPSKEVYVFEVDENFGEVLQRYSEEYSEE